MSIASIVGIFFGLRNELLFFLRAIQSLAIIVIIGKYFFLFHKNCGN